MHYKSHKGLPTRFSPLLTAAAFCLTPVLFANAAATSLAWNASAGPDVAGYKVHYGSAAGTYGKVLDVGKSTQATVADLTAGTYFFAVTAYNSTGQESTRSNEVSAQLVDQPPANKAPVVSVTSPTSGSSYVRRTKITIASTASDSDGTIAKVEFFVGTTKIGEDRSAPYRVAWTPSNTGTYNLVARATDNLGLRTSSTAVSVRITSRWTATKTPATYTSLIESTETPTSFAGAVTLTTTEAGAYSGTVKYDGTAYPVKGRLDENGKATKRIARKGKPDLVLNLESSEENGGALSGTISDGTTEVDFNGKKVAGKSDVSARNAGRWTVLLPPQSPVTGDAKLPQGTSFVPLVINKKGVARLTGTLSDGTPITQGGRLSELGVFPVYVPLYGKKGVVAGRIQLPTTDDAAKAASGTIEWHKPAALKNTKFHPAGFDLTLDVLGEFNSAETGEDPQDPRTGSTKELTLFGGNLTAPIVKTVTVNAKGNVKPIEGDERVKLEIRKSGRFLGSFLDRATSKRRHFVGTILPEQNVGAGFFLGKDETGGVVLDPTE